ncbi:uncharacterized protein BCR38DRAFT_450485 [Pseudomassariella vexata]|uniref:Ubiquitin-activating enzyme E1-like n=1 Tax=Pseudomassariella vexata TaxID=1141098 RepID=A0A1Y2DCI7_9PEZI|nr:uncharacterized protein BCR38DRAFT_450485 [Pseudomassariella vexata]ORY56982.1 hypothetical protein BCR38DRAFT_450485 [Pseudomassariella vexata]
MPVKSALPPSSQLPACPVQHLPLGLSSVQTNDRTHSRRNMDSFTSVEPDFVLTHAPQAKVLMVGAGGIGCELLKNLVLSGYGEVHIVDLDTIDLSNLNRQFLFRYEHIKKSKALVAKEAAQVFNPNTTIVAHHANIKDAQFNIEWFRGFTIVFNALDNLDARRHVNKMCLAADVPLIESGTTGFNGQVQVIKKGVTACYDCTTKETPKSFPVCTIRSTPSQPIHCIVWGKSYLLNEIFGVSEDESAFDHSEDADNANEIAELKKEADALRKIRDSVGTEEFPQLLFDKVFNADITRLRSMEDMWKSRTAPEPLEYKTLKEEAPVVDEAFLQNDQKVWSLAENLAVLNDSLDRLSKRKAELIKETKGNSEPPAITFDKDDPDTLDFVAAAANIRSYIFGIEKKSRFDIKQMAGNIIPAIATTNAIVAGLCVLESFKVLKGEYEKAKEVFLTPAGLQRLLAPDRPRRPDPNCPVCSVYRLIVYVDLAYATLDDLINGFVRKQLGYGSKDLAVSTEAGVVYDSEEEDNLPKKLRELGIGQDSFITVVDEDDDDTFVNVILSIHQATEPLGDKHIKDLEPDKAPEIPRKPKKVPAVESVVASQTNGKTHALDEDPNDGNNKDLKRARQDDSEIVRLPKRLKTTTQSRGDDVVIVDDESGTGAIVIDD